MSEPDTAEFIESLGIVFQSDGLPRIAGRVLGYLIVSEGSRSFAELVRALEVGKGSVSANTRLLVALGAVERTSRPGDRQDYFRLAEAPYMELLERSIDRATRAGQMLMTAGKDISGKKASIRRRLEDLGYFFEVMAESRKEAARVLSTDVRNAAEHYAAGGSND